MRYEANNGEMIGRFAVAVFKRRCEQHPKFKAEPAMVMQMIFDELFNEAQVRESHAEKVQKGRNL
jgi:hypothetical protein